MTKKTHLGSDVLAFMDDIVPNTPETRLVEKQELFRIALTQEMRNVRKQVGLTKQEIAQKLGVDESWVAELENANYNHTFESVLAYLDALGASFEVSIFLKDEPIAVVPAKLSIAREATVLPEQ